MRVLGFLFLCAALAAADPVSEAADAVLEAHRAGRELKDLAAKDDPDPWLVADELCARGHNDVALAFANAAPRPDTLKLPAYVEAWRGDANAASREALAAVDRAVAANDFEAVLAVDLPPLAGVASIRVLYARGMALRRAGAARESCEAFARAAAAAEETGWLQRAADAFGEAGLSALERRLFDLALEPWRNRLAVETRRGNAKGLATAHGNLGILHASLAEDAPAREHLEQALRIAEERDDRAFVARVLQNLGRLHASHGRAAESIDCLERALAIMEALEDHRGIEGVLVNLGRTHALWGRYDEALACFQRLLALSREREDRTGVAGALHLIGTVHAQRGASREAIPFLEEALALFTQLGEPEGIRACTDSLGAAYLGLGRYEVALPYLERALAMSREAGNRKGVAVALSKIGDVYRETGRWEEAVATMQAALELFRELEDPNQVARTLEGLGRCHEFRGCYEEALTCFREALALGREIGHGLGVSLVLGDICGIHVLLGQYDEALTYALQYVDVARDLGKADLAFALRDVAACYRQLARYSDALDWCTRAVAAGRDGGGGGGLAVALLELGNIHNELGQRDRALDRYEQALRIMEEIGDREGVAMVRHNVGTLHFAEGRFEEALLCLEEALEINRESGKRRAIPGTLGSIGAVHVRLGQYDRALEALGRALVAFEELGERDAAARAAGNLGCVHERLGHRDKAIGLFERALAGARESGRAPDISQWAAALGRNLWLEGRAADAIRCFEEAVAAIESQRIATGGVSDEPRAGYLEALRADVDPYALLADAHLTAGDAGAALMAIERGRARGVLDLLARSRFDPLDEAERRARIRDDGDRLVAIARVRADLAAAERDAAACTHALTGKQTPEGRAALEARRKAARAARADAAERRARLVRDLVPAAAPASLAAIQAALGPGERMLVYALFEDESVVFVVPPAGARVQAHLLKPRAEIEEAARAHLDAITRRGGGTRGVDPSSGAGGSAAGRGEWLLDALLPKEARESLRGLDRIYVVPDGILHRLPLESLPVDLPPLVYGHSASVLLWCKRPREFVGTRYQVVALGDPVYGEGLPRLPGTRREVEAIRDALGDGAVKTLLGEGATETAVFKIAPQARYLHIATHLVVEDTDRRGSTRLALTRPKNATPEDDGFLSLFELLERWRDRLSTCELVVLSACATAKGPLQRDEGPYAMPLGFLYAGAPAVIGSLWRVDDASTAELFADFYKRLAEGTPKLEAFTEARKALKEKYPDPYHWAAFVYIGDPR